MSSTKLFAPPNSTLTSLYFSNMGADLAEVASSSPAYTVTARPAYTVTARRARGSLPTGAASLARTRRREERLRLDGTEREGGG